MAAHVQVVQGRGKRALRCDVCRLTLQRCICGRLERIDVRTRLVVLMHRNERLKSSNTGRLAASVLSGAEIHVRGLPGAGDDERVPSGRRLVLFPGSHAQELSPGHGRDGPVVLIVPDGSWSQARKIVQRDALLDTCEPVRLPQVPPSRYILRSGVRSGTVCTFEAIAHALGILEGEDVRDRMLASFDLFQTEALGFRMPPKRHERARRLGRA